MSDSQETSSSSSAPPSEGATSSNELMVNIKGPAELKIQIRIPDADSKTVLELKELIASQDGVDASADRQRLIYSGKVLKDEDPLSKYKIRDADTIHMVKGASKPAGSSSTSSSTNASSTQQPRFPTMAAGQNPHDPLTLLNGPMGHGVALGTGPGAINPFASMGLGEDFNMADPNMMQNMMSSPQFAQQMSAMLSNPAILDQIIAANPQLEQMAPGMRQFMQSEGFRNIMSNPQQMQQMMQMSRQLQQMGFGPPGLGGSPFFGAGAGGGGGSFPAPGVPSTAQGQIGGANTAATAITPASTATTTTGADQQATGVVGAQGQQPNPFAALASMFGAAGAPGAAAGTPGAGAAGNFGAGANAGGMWNPALMNAMFGGAGGFGAPPVAAPADARPAEERFASQLQQLQEMGFTDGAQNVRALLACGGNVQGAVEYILSGGGMM